MIGYIYFTNGKLVGDLEDRWKKWGRTMKRGSPWVCVGSKGGQPFDFKI